MWYYLIKVIVTSVLIVAISEVAKRSSFWAAALASVPLTSLLAFIWLYVESGDTERVATLSQSIFWLVIPSLPLFVLLPVLLRSGFNFWMGLTVTCAVTACTYAAIVWSLGRAGINI